MSSTDAGREPLTLVQIDQDFCSLTYGVAPCTAAGSEKCFNTLASCQDTANYDKDVLTLTFCRPQANVPKGLNAIPSMRSVSTAPTQINPTNGNRNTAPLGQRAVATVAFQDHPHSDILVDPYVADRAYKPLERGTFWSKWLQRTPFYQNRPLRIYEGYVGENLGDMRLREYFIDAIDGPDSNGNVRVVAKDPLKLADAQKAQVPVVSVGKLRIDINKTDTQLDIKGALLADYPATGIVRIGKELIEYTSRVIETIDSIDYIRLSNSNPSSFRAQYGSEAQDHKADALVQTCVQYDDEEVWEVIYDLLTEYAGIPTSYIDFDEWEAEGLLWLSQFNITSIISQPTGVAQILNELFEQVLAYIWWDERDRQIKFRAVRPIILDAPLITDNENIVADSVAISTDPKNRVSQVWVYWDQRDLSEKLDEEANYQQVQIRADLDAESDIQYGESRIRKIYARWIQNGAQATNLAARLLGASYQNPKVIKLKLDAKDRAIWTADVVDVLHRNIVDFTGQPQVERYQVFQVEEIQPGEVVEYELHRFLFRGSRFGYYMASDAGSFEDATEEEREGNVAWYADADGLMSDGSQGWEYI